MFNQRQPRRFKYKSHISNSEEKDTRENLKSKWDDLRGNTKRKGNFLTSLPALIIFLASVFVLMYILNGYLK